MIDFLYYIIYQYYLSREKIEKEKRQTTYYLMSGFILINLISIYLLINYFLKDADPVFFQSIVLNVIFGCIAISYIANYFLYYRRMDEIIKNGEEKGWDKLGDKGFIYYLLYVFISIVTLGLSGFINT